MDNKITQPIKIELNSIWEFYEPSEQIGMEAKLDAVIRKSTSELAEVIFNHLKENYEKDYNEVLADNLSGLFQSDLCGRVIVFFRDNNLKIMLNDGNFDSFVIVDLKEALKETLKDIEDCEEPEELEEYQLLKEFFLNAAKRLDSKLNEISEQFNEAK